MKIVYIIVSLFFSTSLFSATLDDGLEALKIQDYKKAEKIFLKSCQNKEFKGCSYVGLLYEYGLIGKRNSLKAKEFYQKACDGDFMEGCHNLANQMQQEKLFQKAAPLYKKACNHKYAASCSSLGMLYIYGAGVKKNYKKAYELHDKACKEGDIQGCHDLGVMYENGLYVKPNSNKAMEFYEESCKKDFAQSCTGYAILYGKENLKDKPDLKVFKKIRKYAKKACNLGDEQGCLVLTGVTEQMNNMFSSK